MNFDRINEESENTNSDIEQNLDENISKIKDMLQSNEWSEVSSGIFEKKTKQFLYKIEFDSSIAESKFLAAVRALLLEDIGDGYPIKLTLIDSNDSSLVYGPYKLNITNDYEQLKSEIGDIIRSISQTTNKSNDDLPNILTKILKRLSPEEQDAFGVIYGNKLIDLLNIGDEK